MDIINSKLRTSDINIDLLKYAIHMTTNDNIYNIFSPGFVPLIHKPFKLIPPTATLINHIYTSDISTNRCSSGIIITDIAYNLGTFHLVKNKKHNSSQLSDMRRIFSETNPCKFKQLLYQLNFDNIMEIECPNNAFNPFMTLYKDAFESAFPIQSIKSNRKYITREPWVTPGLLVSLRTKIKP